MLIFGSNVIRNRAVPLTSTLTPHQERDLECIRRIPADRDASIMR